MTDRVARPSTRFFGRRTGGSGIRMVCRGASLRMTRFFRIWYKPQTTIGWCAHADRGRGGWFSRSRIRWCDRSVSACFGDHLAIRILAKKGSSRIWLQPSRTGRRIATTSAVVLSQARGNGGYPHFRKDTFPAVPAQETAASSTCRASLKACLSTLSRTESHPFATIHCRRGPVARPRLRKIARRVS